MPTLPQIAESPAIVTLKQPPARNRVIREKLPKFPLLSLTGFLISNLMGIMMFLIMLVGNEMHANIHSLFNSAG